MAVFESLDAELKATEDAAEELLRHVAHEGVDSRSVMRLEKLAMACARLAYPNGLNVRVNVHNLIAWCDHLNDDVWKARFLDALHAYPLVSPWDEPNPSLQRTAMRPLS